jgi:hypothetical protein
MDRQQRQLEERIAHLEIEIKMQQEWNEIPESLKPTSEGRWEQMKCELQAQESRRLGWPSNY